ncbi:hypothetical protein [Maridesulfovibrio zosterae]|uniref:hypothetical protein n=1 Tax=Maridesulfovibrio zosterae TaxID=82171 RepID=UPI00041CF8F1|nr:hypothetical protein [Maridesulfovibrio zosterae]
MRMRFFSLVAVLLLIVACGCTETHIPTPQWMGKAPSFNADPGAVLSYFEGIPYRNDGAINRFGDFTLFADQERRFEKPGLNCSGFVVAASRYFFKHNYMLSNVTFDRLGDSGKDALNGQDWDFGYDLILNITEGMNRKVVLPFGETADIDGSNGMTLRGFGLHDKKAWKDVIASMHPGKIYLFSMSKPVKFKNYNLLYYHVGLIVPDKKGHLWLCHATTKAGVNKVDITQFGKLENIIEANPDTELGPRKILIIETAL